MAELDALLEEVQKLSDKERAQFITEVISRQSVLWLSELIKTFEEKFGVQASMAPVAAIPSAPAAPQAPAEEKTAFDIILKAPGEKKLEVIKIVRAATNLGLREAKELVDKAPQPIKTGISKDEAEKIKKDLEAAGASIEIK